MTQKIYIEENGDYLKNNPNWHVEDSPWKAKQILKMLRQNQLEPKTIAEIGCGAGEILNQLHSVLPEDTQFTGFDISIDAIQLANQRKKERLEFKHENLLETDNYFDLLLMIDVFEHVEDYLGFLRSSKNKAAHTIFHIPLDLTAWGIFKNALIPARKSVGHIHYFMKDTALATLTDAGFDIVDHFYTEWYLDLTPKKSLKAKIKAVFIKAFYKINKDKAVRFFGGVSLLVLAKETNPGHSGNA